MDSFPIVHGFRCVADRKQNMKATSALQSSDLVSVADGGVQADTGRQT